MKKLKLSLKGLAIGLVNGLIGAGGGMLAVPILTAGGLSQIKAHATSVAVIFPLSVFSAYLYLRAGSVHLADTYAYLVPGILGALSGVYLLKKIPQKLLRFLFGLLALFSGVRLLIK